ncbi:hypothetical protein AQUCO_08200030v1 [Aquilegia coerulea]|uniref:Disease resistance protein At4g27190-like leucine-rich repeats domain-containing protein n=1 Tax=Aquilegia coerulea TaxID=218851 RepID=A0A2G5C8U9_AQUCA|nr:hypothetical protein AQUCO_08200030v1 [Aquilegia coerulea]
MEPVSFQQNCEAFKVGLSNQCPPVIENVVQKILHLTESIFLGAIILEGWNNIGRERILKYVAKRAMETKGFQVVIWMIQPKNASKLKKFEFQRRVAHQLGIAPYFSRNDDSDCDEEEENEKFVDTNVKDKIQTYLEQKKFVLVHNADWGLFDLESMGIPVLGGANSAMVLVVASNKFRMHHEVVSMDNDLSDGDLWDLLLEECVDIITDYPILRRDHHITPEVIMDCIMCSNFSSYNVAAKNSLRHWFVEGFIGGATLDLKTTFDLGQVLFQALADHNIVFYTRDITQKMLQSNRFSHKVQRVYNSLKDYLSLSPHDCSKISIIKEAYMTAKVPENFFQNMINVRILELYIYEHSLPSSIICLVNLRYLKLGTSYRSAASLQLSPIRALKKIVLLDLSITYLGEFPNDIFEDLQSLRLLDLSNCSKLLSLPSSMSCLINLEHLSLESCESLSCIPSSIQGFEKLQVLYLTKTNLATIPEQFFQHMYKIKVLDLSFNRLLKTIPMTFSNLVNCQQLNLQSCESLQSLTPWLGSQQGSLPIEDLNLSSCSSLQNIDHIISSFSTTLPNIKSLNLTSTPVSQLSLKSCSSLETIHLQSNTTLQKLDLSGTKVNNFLLNDDLNLVSLKQLVLFNIKPGRVTWDQFGDGSTPHMYIQPTKWRKDGNGDGMFISVGNANMFRTLTSSSTLWETSMSRFLVYLCPGEEWGKVKGLPLKKASLLYKDILSKFKLSIPSYGRCLEIERVSKFPKFISGVLCHAQYMTLHDETAIMRLSDFGIENMKELKECLLQRCHTMKVVFFVTTSDMARDQHLLSCLEKLQIYNLKKLTNISFSQLKHLQIEHCPQLVNMFSCSVFLKSLEVLQIKFCARLEEIFSGKENEEGSLERLHTLYFLELPALKNIVHNVQLVSLNKAKVKGCPRLRELPLQSRSTADKLKKIPSIVVTGELDWWEQLEWKDSNAKHQITFNTWKPFQLPRNS